MPAASFAPRPFPSPDEPYRALTYRSDPYSGDPAAALFVPGELFGAAELAAMAMEGIIREVLPRAYAPARAPDGPHLRAAAAGLLAGRRLGGKWTGRQRTGSGWTGSEWTSGSAVGRLSAAWIYGCCPAPQRLDLLVPRFHRLPAHADPLPVQLSEARLGAEDVVRIGSVPVTSPPRTAVDVALSAPEAEALAVLARLFAAPGLGCTGAAVLGLLEGQARRPGRVRARERIERVLGAAP